VNGRFVTTLPAPGEYVEIDRTWNAGDTVSLVLPKRLRIERLTDDPTRAALMWGPLVLAGDLGPSPAHNGTEGEQPAPKAPALVTTRDVVDWLEPVANRAGVFRASRVAVALDATKRAQQVELAPFYAVQRRTYVVYWDLLTPAQHEARVAEIAREQAAQRRLDAASIAVVRAGDANAEQAFAFQGAETSIVRADGRAGRRATKWFSYDLPIDSSTPVALVVTFNTDNRRPRTFDILIDGTKIQTVEMPKSSISRFVDTQYPVPEVVLRNKAKVTVRFEATGGSEIVPVFAVRFVRLLPPSAA
jgi:hypothetical protein